MTSLGLEEHKSRRLGGMLTCKVLKWTKLAQQGPWNECFPLKMVSIESFHGEEENDDLHFSLSNSLGWIEDEDARRRREKP